MKDLERGRRVRHPGDRGSDELRRKRRPCGSLLCTVGKGTNLFFIEQESE